MNGQVGIRLDKSFCRRSNLGKLKKPESRTKITIVTNKTVSLANVKKSKIQFRSKIKDTYDEK